MEDELYTTLGVGRNATPAEIKKARNEKAKANHSDKGGKDTEMAKINNAFMVLSDPERRKLYDETGETKDESFEIKFSKFVTQLLPEVMQQTDADYEDLIGNFKQVCQQKIIALGKTLEHHQENKKVLEKVQRRLKTKGNKILLDIVDNQINGFKKSIKGIGLEIDFVSKCILVLEDYSYHYDSKEPSPQQNYMFFNQQHLRSNPFQI